MTTGKQVPLAEVSRLREQRRKLQAEVARLEAEKQGWLVEKAHLILALDAQRGSDGVKYERTADVQRSSISPPVIMARADRV